MEDDLQLLNQALAGRYHLADEIGRGGMATVYRARDLRHDRPVAVKVLKPHLSATLGAARFLREIAVTAQLDHPHILPLLDSGEAEGLLYYVMPYVEGESLRERLDREKQLSLDDALRIVREIADALSYAHGRGIVHRDIKPSNILLSGGHARVADFGIARAVKAAGGDASLTETGLAIGTPTYMSPEQASGDRDVDARTDVYSLGCVLYEMLSGQPPYTGVTAEAIMARKLHGPLPSLRIVRDTIPAGVETAITKALARVPADRFASAAEFAEALAIDRAVGSPEARPSRVARGLRVGVPILAAAAAVFLIVAKTGERGTSSPRATDQPRIESIAVLPLENLSGDAEQDYFAAGIHEALIVHLGKLSGLDRVIARPSVMRFVKTGRSPRQIANELGVNSLITGTVLRSGNKIRITAQLIDPNTERQLWGESYEREMRDVLALQNEIVTAIAREVQLKLSPGDRATLARTRTVNPQAYEAYLRGKFHLNKFTAEGFERAMALFNQAIAIDPSEPLAYAGLATGYSLMEVLTESSSPDAVRRAKAAALKAVELDSTLAEAHDALSSVRVSEFDYVGARQSIEHALELNPNLAEAHIHHAWYLSVFGTEGEAVAEMRRGVELDPLSPLYNAWLGGLYWEYSRFDEAIAQAHKAMDLQPDFPVALYVLGLSLADKGQHAEAIAVHRRGMEKYPNRSFAWTLARTYAVAGRTESARQILRTLESGRPIEPVHPWFIAAAYGALGDYEKAMQWLEKAYETRSLFLPNLKRDRSAGLDLRPLRNHPRFNSLLRRVNLLAPS
jgi:eukaryotic-like serine/threonine-protein kinase